MLSEPTIFATQEKAPVFPSFSAVADQLQPTTMSSRSQALQPTYLGVPNSSQDEPTNFFSRFLKEQVFAKEHRSGNISVAIGTSTFVAGILFVRSFGYILDPGV